MMSLNSFESNLDIIAEAALVADSSRWADALDFVVNRMSKGKAEKRFADIARAFGDDIGSACDRFAVSSDNVLIIGPGVIDAPDRSKILRSIRKMKDEYSWKVVVAHQYTNLAGMIAMGAFPGIKPGEAITDVSTDRGATIKIEPIYIDLKKKRKLVYLIGDASFDILPECDYLVYQNALPIKFIREPDLILPVSPFTEASGTIINAEGKLLQVKEAVTPFMDSRPDWWILNSISEKAGKGKMKFVGVDSIQKDIKRLIKGFPNVKKRIEFKKIESRGAVRAHGKGRPAARKGSYRGIPLAEVVSGIKVIEGGRQ